MCGLRGGKQKLIMIVTKDVSSGSKLRAIFKKNVYQENSTLGFKKVKNTNVKN